MYCIVERRAFYFLSFFFRFYRNSSATQSKPKEKSEKERYFEEQQKKLKQFHKPGTVLADPTSSLVDNLFGPASQKQGVSKGQGQICQGQQGSREIISENAKPKGKDFVLNYMYSFVSVIHCSLGFQYYLSS